MPQLEPTPRPPPELGDFLQRYGLMRAGENVVWSPLTGGVSSDIWKADLPGRSLCVKRALPKLKVAADWQAPVSRNAYEWAWLQFAAGYCPQNVPRPLAHDNAGGLFAMEFLAPEAHPVWKDQLLGGRVEASTARDVGLMLGTLHSESAGRSDLAATFASDANFYALRLEPYLVATATRHPDAADGLLRLAHRTAATKLAVVHGDVSPKNILVGPHGPVLLDAECAWFGDSAFDIAFCLNHLLLKCIVQPALALDLHQSFRAFREAYMAKVNWEDTVTLDVRAGDLLPGLLLARCDGKSPVEYLTLDSDRAFLRSIALPLLKKSPQGLAMVADAWFEAVARRTA